MGRPGHVQASPRACHVVRRGGRASHITLIIVPRFDCCAGANAEVRRTGRRQAEPASGRPALSGPNGPATLGALISRPTSDATSPTQRTAITAEHPSPPVTYFCGRTLWDGPPSSAGSAEGATSYRFEARSGDPLPPCRLGAPAGGTGRDAHYLVGGDRGVGRGDGRLGRCEDDARRGEWNVRGAWDLRSQPRAWRVEARAGALVARPGKTPMSWEWR